MGSVVSCISENKKNNRSTDSPSTSRGGKKEWKKGSSNSTLTVSISVDEDGNKEHQQDLDIETYCDYEYIPNHNDKRMISKSLNDIQLNRFNLVKSSEFYLNQRQFKLFTSLPQEVQVFILQCLPARDLIQISQTNHFYNQLSKERTMWRERCFSKDWIIQNQFDTKFNFKSYYFEKNALNSKNFAKWVSPKFFGQLPSKRFKHTATCFGKKVLFIGGQETDTKRFNEIIYYDTETQTFSKPSVKGDRVPNFSRHSASLVHDKIYIFGGFDGHGTNFDLATYNTSNRYWTNIPKEAIKGSLPHSRTNHASAVVGKNVYIFGGNNNDENGRYQVLDDLHVLNTNELEWSQPNVTGDKPCARSGHCMTSIGTKLYLFGGGVWNEDEGWVEKFNDIHIFDTETHVWTKPPVKGDVQTSTFAISFNVGRFLFIFGGGSKPGHCVTNEIYVLDTETNYWIVPSIEDPSPPARDMGTACVCNGDVYFLGGYSGGPIDYFNKLKFNYKVLANLAKDQRQDLIQINQKQGECVM
ncbi:hypothetical protein CYY_002745 [Polysphondylium violaceum]|uniref:F-box domain-containing protein n=1 Tax=Polysphondylium violaceum TaxID=133409 RepID=A0A8J4Q0R4_9MYCE|nr:hypothetical protein CYY_002745 [Polysphondylium violaceum]